MRSLSDLVQHTRPLSTGSMAVYPYSPVLERKFRFTTRFGDEVLLHRIDKRTNTIHLPRAVCPVGVKDDRVVGKVVHFPKCPTPRENQVKIFQDTAKFLLNGQSGVVSAYTGWGKLVLGFYAAYAVKRKTLVVTTKDDIYQQWLKGAQDFLGLAPEDVGEIRGDKCEVVGTKFCVAMIQSLSKDGKYPDWITNEFGLVIIDECHRFPADQFSEIVYMLPAALRLGLSATVDRSDGKEVLLHAHIGPVRCRTGSEELVPKVLVFKSAWECPRVLRSDPDTGAKKVVRLPHTPGKTAHIEKMLAADPARNHLIAQLVHEAFSKGRKIVVFSTLHDHLRSLHRACHEAFGISGRDMGFYIGASSKAEKQQREREKTKSVLFTTYAMMCLPGDTELIDPLKGSISRLDKGNHLVVGRTEKSYILANSSEFAPAGIKPCVTVTSPLGSFTASTDHRVFTQRGWVEAGQLQLTDVMASSLFPQVPVTDIPELTADDLWLLGAMIGDGTFSSSPQGELSSWDDEIVTKANKVLARHNQLLVEKRTHPRHYALSQFDTGCSRGRYNKSWSRVMSERFDLQRRCEDKMIPPEWMLLPDEKIAALLAGLLDTDGYVTSSKPMGVVGYSAKNKALAEQVAFLMRRLGVPTAKVAWSGDVWTVRSARHGSRVLSKLPWALTRKRVLCEKGALLTFGATKLDLLHPTHVRELKTLLRTRGVGLKEAERKLAALGYAPGWFRLNKPGLGTAARELLQALNIPCPAFLTGRWVPVQFVRDAGEREVGDVSVPGPQNYEVSGVIVHNSEGTNLNWLDTCILGMPRAKVTQPVGRIRRSHPGKGTPVVMDVQDHDSPVFSAYCAARLKWYQSIGCPVVEMN